MAKLHPITSVWVPFEILAGDRDDGGRKCDTLPRFATAEDVKRYLSINSNRLSRRKLQWREHTEKDLIKEYIAGVGTLKILI